MTDKQELTKALREFARALDRNTNALNHGMVQCRDCMVVSEHSVCVADPVFPALLTCPACGSDNI